MFWWPFATKPERADTLEVIDLHSGAPLLYSTRFFENRVLGTHRTLTLPSPAKRARVKKRNGSKNSLAHSHGRGRG